AFSFDIAVQNWSLNIQMPEYITIDQAENILLKYGSKNAEIWLGQELTIEKATLVIAAHYRALKSNPKWQQDVFARKATIAMGIGYVHGKKHLLEKLF